MKDSTKKENNNLAIEPLDKYKKSKNNQTPIWKDTFWNNYLYTESNKLISQALKEPLDFNHLFHIQDVFKFKRGYEKMKTSFKKLRTSKPEISLREIYHKNVKGHMIKFEILKWIVNIFQIPIPFVIKWLLEWTENPEAPVYEGYLYALFLAFGAYLLPLCEPISSVYNYKAERETINGIQVNFL